MAESHLREIDQKLDHLLGHVHIMQQQMNLIINLLNSRDNSVIAALTQKLKEHTAPLQSAIQKEAR